MKYGGVFVVGDWMETLGAAHRNLEEVMEFVAKAVPSKPVLKLQQRVAQRMAKRSERSLFVPAEAAESMIAPLEKLLMSLPEGNEVPSVRYDATRMLEACVRAAEQNETLYIHWGD